MKIRNGFVSNSSSSSFIVLLPEDFDVEKHVEENVDKVNIGNILERFDPSEDIIDEEAYAKEKTIEIIKDFIDNHCIYNYETTTEYYTIMEILSDYVIAEMEAYSGDSGQGILLDSSDIKQIRNILKIK